MEEHKTLREIENVHIYKVVLIPLFTMIVLTLAIYSVIFYNTLSKSKQEILDKIESDVLQSMSYFQEEVFLGNHTAVSKRIDYMNDKTRNTDNFSICLDTQLTNSSRQVEFKTKNCNQLSIVEKSISIVVGEELYGYINLYVFRKGSLLSSFPRELILANIAAVIISLLLISFLINRLKRKIIIPVQHRIEKDAKSIAIAKTKEKISKRVAHDIRSPLAALKMIVDGNEFKRIEVQILFEQICKRLNGIADSILKDGKECEKAFDLESELEKLKTEKEIEHKFNSIKIISTTKLPQITSCPKDDLIAVISNLLNNSIEAEANIITVRLSHLLSEKFIMINIEDNGKGIPEDIVEKIGQKGVSFQKENGNGLGVFNAKELLNNISGRFELKSVVSQGTKISLFIPV